MRVPISEIKVNPGRRLTCPAQVRELAQSISELGLLNPITIDRDNILIAGLHRLEAAKSLQWTEIECTVSRLEGLRAELAEIDENFVRNRLSPLDHGELLLRRKEIYETLHPETKATYDGGRFRGNQHKGEVTAESAATSTLAKSFTQDAADKLGLAPRTIREQVQAAKNLTPEAKQIIRETDTKLTQKNALQLSRLEPEHQKDAARKLASGEIRSISDYEAPPPAPPFQPEDKHFSSFAEAVADLKDANKDCSSTPDSFLMEVTAFTQKFQRSIAWYSTPYYEAVFPFLSSVQLDYLRQQMDLIRSAADNLYSNVERKQKYEQSEQA